MSKEGKAILITWSLSLITLIYPFLITSKITNPIPRLISLLPLFTLYIYLPLTLSSTLPPAIFSFFFTWLTSFKLILFSFNLGPLSPLPTSFIRFILAAAFPIKFKVGPTSPNDLEMTLLPLGIGSKGFIFVVLLGVSDLYRERLRGGGIVVIYCFMLYLFIDLLIGVCNLVVGPIFGVELCPPSDEPYVATSLREFWGRRWNLVVTDALRHTVYKPTRLFLYNYFGWAWEYTLGPGVITSFLVSGLMHELIFYYMTRVRPTWEVTCFFVLNGVCVVVEVGLKRSLGCKVKLHWALMGPLTIGFVICTGYWLFFPTLLRNHVDVKAIEETKLLVKFVVDKFKH